MYIFFDKKKGFYETFSEFDSLRILNQNTKIKSLLSENILGKK